MEKKQAVAGTLHSKTIANRRERKIKTQLLTFTSPNFVSLPLFPLEIAFTGLQG